MFHCLPGPCHNSSRAVNISDIAFLDIYGTYTDKYAGQLLCSDASPCQNVRLDNIDLKASKAAEDATTPEASSAWNCWKVKGSSDNVQPPPCI